MKTELRALTNCIGGELIAEDIYNKNGVILIAKDTELNEYIIDKLLFMEIPNISVYSNEEEFESEKAIHFKKRYRSAVGGIKELFQELTVGKPLDVKRLSSITNLIQSSLTENDHIKYCLSSLRNTDEYTYTHCINVAFYSMLIAKWYKLSEEEVVNVIQSGLLHDIGKSKIPLSILNKNGQLTDAEYEIIKQHTILGYELVKDMTDIKQEIKQAILLHHERMDGSGYPYHYSVDRINLYTKIVSLADVFDAMTSERVYKKRSTPFEAFDMFQTMGIKMFDLHLINLFLKNLAVYLIGLKVYLSTDEIGEIVYVPIQRITDPIVKVGTSYLDFSKETSIKILYML